ncbi:GNAT family N-acetyltransferase [Pseudoalteromonas piscicida]|uniref:GNAT family N-acetyltransferase n=1 Tax=Pseudoalteromonas piscicida TaxID=43662 RepID=UPI001F5B659C|nr:GNAT family N-acetyltransferase [Pseudoalteromonas piscicida]
MAELELIRVDKYSEQIFTKLFAKSSYHQPFGSFELCSASNMAYLFYADGKLVGFTIIGISNRRNFEICALYIIPSERRKGYATGFLAQIWAVYKGRWKVSMQDKVESSCAFWQATMHKIVKPQPSLRGGSDEYAFAV